MTEQEKLPKWRQAYAARNNVVPIKKVFTLTPELILAGMKYDGRCFQNISDQQMRVFDFRLSSKRKSKRAEQLIGKRVTAEQYTRFLEINTLRGMQREQSELVGRRRRERRKLQKQMSKPRKKPGRWNPTTSKDFYASKQWRDLRYAVIERHKGKCCACGQSYKEHGVVMHVDHIKPRSKYPELELDPGNLQLLCEICNVAKSNKYETDWR